MSAFDEYLYLYEVDQERAERSARMVPKLPNHDPKYVNVCRVCGIREEDHE